MTLSIAGQALANPDGLSEAARLCLSLIDGGAPWLQWSIAQPAASYAFPDEAALVQGVQSGLHGSALMVLPGLGLTAGPARLLALGAAPLAALARAEASGKATAALGKILTEYNLLTGAGLAAGAAWLAGQGGADSPLFQVMTLQDRIAQAGAAGTDTADAALAKAASAFALAEARTPAEFLDYRRLYLALAARAPDATAAQQQEQASQCIGVLLPWMFTALDCPGLPPPVSPDDAGPALNAWLKTGRLLGFASAAAGARQICERTAFTAETPDVGAAIAGYLRQAAAAIQAGPLTGVLNQDGQSATLQAGAAVIAASAAGILSLDDFVPPAETA